MVPIVVSASAARVARATLPLAELSSGSIRQAPDGWHVVLRIEGVQYHLWLKQAPELSAFYSAELPLDSDYEIRAHAAHRLWRVINGRPPGPSFYQLSAQRRQRLALALRAFDGHVDGASYREIAEVLFDRKRIAERSWKTHELRSLIIRLVQDGLALISDGYRALLRPPSRKK
ncbi:DUF2285 domain-containing protein [Bradyrhizobium sp. Tv2a-2]|uniref:DUF2285 domain-containing protein n=1 Tax=Bradyrhizobium sp. Tv2a-2 TaxID=113395 RepID=UPI000464D4C7|nr:DUF2285 domain-containing protein [Bradyrhizobium sp. Tv2a-2]